MIDLHDMAERLVAQPLADPPTLADLRRRNRRRHRRIALRSGLTVAVVALVVVLVVALVPDGTGRPQSNESASLASYIVTAAQTPDNVLTEVGLPGSVVPPTVRSGQPALTDGGKPAVVYVGAEYCPYCAVARWALVVALANFGDFGHLGQEVSSSSNDVFPGIQSWSFHGSSYSSPYLTFDPAEIYSSTPVHRGNGGSYMPLDQMSPLQQQAFGTYNTVQMSGGGLPFIDIDNRYFVYGASASPQVLEGLTLDQIAADLSDPSSPVARAIDGTANYIVAALCNVIGPDAPPICKAPFVAQAQFKPAN